MGLDMYLDADLYISGYDHSGEESKARLRAVLEAAGLPTSLLAGDSPHAEVSVCVAYWRKANAIHRWFVENVQEGEDDCDKYYVSREQLTALRDACKRALEVASVADNQPVHAGTTYRAGQDPEQHFEIGRAVLNGSTVADILPTQEGFFFGATDYDEWYLRNLENTVKQLDNALAIAPDRCSFYYHSSW